MDSKKLLKRIKNNPEISLLLNDVGAEVGIAYQGETMLLAIDLNDGIPEGMEDKYNTTLDRISEIASSIMKSEL